VIAIEFNSLKEARRNNMADCVLLTIEIEQAHLTRLIDLSKDPPTIGLEAFHYEGMR
jgi:hypothetical protein